MSRFKKITHVFAVGITAVVGFAFTDAGQAIIRQYPKLTGISVLLGMLGTLLHDPKAPQ